MIPVSEEQKTQPDPESSIELQFPTLPLNRSLASWLDRSQLLIMGSTADDSSVDENTGCVEDSVWDIIDEASVVTSDDEDRNLSRQPTPSSDGHDQEMEGNLEGSNMGYEKSQSRGMPLSNDDIHEGSAEAVEESWNSGLTDFGANHGTEGVRESHESDTIPQDRGSIKFHDPQMNDSDTSEHVNVVHTVKAFEGENLEDLCRCFRLTNPPSRAIGTIRQCMSRQTLRLNGPYRLLYIGPPSAKQAIVKKISAALASSLDTSSTISQSPTSRFSIVPISAFCNKSSPEVVLIDHTGLEIYVEECTSASYVKKDNGKDTIYLNLDNGRYMISSSWNHKTFTASNNYTPPNLAIVCIAEDENTAAKQTRVLARSFVTRHDTPVIVVSVEAGWNKPAQAITLDHRTPHCSVEAYEPSDGIYRVLKRLPIDLPSFLDIEAVQMSRNLACLSQETIEASRNGVAQSQSRDTRPNSTDPTAKKGWLEELRFQTSPTAWSIAKVARLLIYGALFSIVMLSLNGSKSASTLENDSGDIVNLPSIRKLPLSTTPVASPPLSTTANLVPKIKTTEKSELPRTKSVSAHTSTNVASLLLESYPLTPNKSEKFQIQIVGDCHVVLRPPHWFTVLKKSPALLIKVTRHGELLDYSFSTLFEGVYALQLSNEDAYGTVDVSVWTIKKPRIHETLQVDFGTPWLRVAGWRKASQVATEQVREELQSAQTGLASVYEQTAIGIQIFMKQAVARADHALKEVEKAGLTSLNQTAKTTEIMIAHSKELSLILTQQLRRGSKAASHLLAQREHMHRDITGLTRKMSDLLSWQAQIMSNAASRLNVINLAHELQEYRKTHLIESQKQAIRIWWTFRGGPPPKRPVLKMGPKSNRESLVS